MTLLRPLTAEFIGTFWLVFGGCGSAVLAAAFPDVGIGLLGVSLAFGLTVLTMAYAIGHISGCHLNPAVSIGLAVGRRFRSSEVLPYIGAQVAGAILAAFVLYIIASGRPGFTLDGGLAANGYGVALPRRVHPGGGARHRDRAHDDVSRHHPRRHRRSRATRVRSHRDRPCLDADSLDRHPRHQPLGQSRAQHRTSGRDRGLGLGTALDVLGRADRWCRAGRAHVCLGGADRTSRTRRPRVAAGTGRARREALTRVLEGASSWTRPSARRGQPSVPAGFPKVSSHPDSFITKDC